MGASLYDTDILAWSAAQAERLRRLAAGERVNDLDWQHVIEEVEDLGQNQLRAVRSLLRQAMLHALKVLCYPGHPAIPHWRIEIAAFLARARDVYQPGMAQWLDVAAVYQKARNDLVRDPLDDASPLTPPASLEIEAQRIMSDEFSRDALLREIALAFPGERP